MAPAAAEEATPRTPRGIGAYWNMFKDGYDEVKNPPPRIIVFVRCVLCVLLAIADSQSRP